jgi:hypothetical protein
MNEKPLRFFTAFFSLIVLTALAQGKDPASPAPFDVVIKGGVLYDGTGGKPRVTDVAIRGDRIAGLGNFPAAKARVVIDAKGMDARTPLHCAGTVAVAALPGNSLVEINCIAALVKK